MGLLIIANPACGAGQGHAFIQEQVLPLLEKEGRHADKIVVTESREHAETAFVDFVSEEAKAGSKDVSVILSSGDGTLHELVNALENVKPPVSCTVKIALVPTGTANALYASLFTPTNPEEHFSAGWKLKSVQALLDGGRQTTPLTLSKTEIYGPGTDTSPQKHVISCVVTSTALHAAILHDSEELRSTIPGIERFKVAAMNNLEKWYRGKVRLLPTLPAKPGLPANVYQFDKDTKTFVKHPESTGAASEVVLEGPFAYFLSTVNVDRLETAFVITPWQRIYQPPPGCSMEVVIVRPLRDPSTAGYSEEGGQSWSRKLGFLLTSAYNLDTPGSHVLAVYGQDGEGFTTGDGIAAVEYIRCGGWEWIPEESDGPAHLLCADGTIFEIAKGGKAVCRVDRAASAAKIEIYN